MSITDVRVETFFVFVVESTGESTWTKLQHKHFWYHSTQEVSGYFVIKVYGNRLWGKFLTASRSCAIIPAKFAERTSKNHVVAYEK